MSTSDRDLGGEPPCMMASLDEEGNVTDARSPASTQVITRTDPPTVGPEKVMLEAFLDYHRATLLQKVSGVSDADLRRQLVPSLTTLLGLVKHLAYVERSWFQIVFAGEDLPVPWTKDDPDPDFRIASGETTEEILALYREQVARSRAITAAASLDDLARSPGRECTLRWIMVHMIEETARHNGHADILRELIDGATGE
jgi:uncharacterized damage-inducible protein DinB